MECGARAQLSRVKLCNGPHTCLQSGAPSLNLSRPLPFHVLSSLTPSFLLYITENHHTLSLPTRLQSLMVFGAADLDFSPLTLVIIFDLLHDGLVSPTVTDLLLLRPRGRGLHGSIDFEAFSYCSSLISEVSWLDLAFSDQGLGVLRE